MYNVRHNLQPLPVAGHKLDVNAVHPWQRMTHDALDGRRIRHAVGDAAEGVTKAVKRAMCYACNLARPTHHLLNGILSASARNVARVVSLDLIPHQWLAVLTQKQKLVVQVGTPATTVGDGSDCFGPERATAINARFWSAEPMPFQVEGVATNGRTIRLTKGTVNAKHDACSQDWLGHGKNCPKLRSGPEVATCRMQSHRSCRWTPERLSEDWLDVVGVRDPFERNADIANGITDSARRAFESLDDGVEVSWPQVSDETMTVEQLQDHLARTLVPHVLYCTKRANGDVPVPRLEETVEARVEGGLAFQGGGGVCVCGDICPCEVFTECGVGAGKLAEVNGFSFDRLIPLAGAKVCTKLDRLDVGPFGFGFHAGIVTQEISVVKIGSRLCVEANKPHEIKLPGVAQRLEPGTHKLVGKEIPSQNKGFGKCGEASNKRCSDDVRFGVGSIPVVLGGQGRAFTEDLPLIFFAFVVVIFLAILCAAGGVGGVH